MPRLLLRFAIALLTFLIGLAAAFAFGAVGGTRLRSGPPPAFYFTPPPRMHGCPHAFRDVPPPPPPPAPTMLKFSKEMRRDTPPPAR